MNEQPPTTLTNTYMYTHIHTQRYSHIKTLIYAYILKFPLICTHIHIDTNTHTDIIIDGDPDR